MGKRKTKPESPARHSLIPQEMWDHMTYVYNGAVDVARRAGIFDRMRAEAKGETTKGRKAAPITTEPRRARINATPPAEVVEWVLGNQVKFDMPTHLIRAVAVQFPNASVAEIRAALPNLNPSTVGIQVGRARRAEA